MSEAARASREPVTSEEYYRTLWNHAVDAKVIVDAQGVIRDVNRRTEFKLGRTGAELIGTPVVNVFWDHDRTRFRRVLTQVVTGGKERSISGLHVPTLSGAVLTMDVEIVPVERTGGEMTVLLQFED